MLERWRAQLTVHSNDDNQTYFGLWSATDVERAADLLIRLGARFEIVEYEATEEVLRDWCAWDVTSSTPHKGYDLWIWSDDLQKVGTAIVDTFPERKFGA